MLSCPRGGGKVRRQGGWDPDWLDPMYILAVSGLAHLHQNIIQAMGIPTKARREAHVRRQLCQAKPASPAREARRDQRYCRVSAESKKGVGECCRFCAQESCPEGREDQQGSGADDSPFRGLLFSKKGDGYTDLTWAVGRGQSGGFSHTQAEGDGQARKGKSFPI